jgi:hypothetical protein
MLESIIDENEWKTNSYWNENTEKIILKYRKVLDRLFDMFAGLKKKQINKIKFMSFDDFKAFISETKIMGPELADRDIN